MAAEGFGSPRTNENPPWMEGAQLWGRPGVKPG
jgi:hypothetical protein